MIRPPEDYDKINATIKGLEEARKARDRAFAVASWGTALVVGSWIALTGLAVWIDVRGDRDCPAGSVAVQGVRPGDYFMSWSCTAVVSP